MPCAVSLRLRGGAAVVVCLIMFALLGARPAAAETLVEALDNAYLINPVLNSERARLRATDERVAIAKSGMRPNITASGDTAFRNTDSDIAGANAQGKPEKCSPLVSINEPAFCSFLENSQENINNEITSDGITHPGGYAVSLSQP